MKYSIKFLLAVVVISIAACNGGKKTKDGFKVLSNGLEVKITDDKPGDKADSGSVAMHHMIVKVNDSVVFDSKQMNNNQPIQQIVFPSKSIADLMAGMMELSQGDKAIFRMKSDSIFKNPAQRPPFIKGGEDVTYEVEITELKTMKQITKENADALANEGKAIDAYLKANNMTGATKTPKGVYVQTISEGSGEMPSAGKLVTMNYTGRLLDGTVFDSNEDAKFMHKEPFKFVLGQGQVIPGWDEAIATMKKGSKAKLVIPSGQAYGTQSRPGNDLNPKGIPANSTLVFDVQLIGFEDAPAPQQPQMQVNPDGTVTQ